MTGPITAPSHRLASTAHRTGRADARRTTVARLYATHRASVYRLCLRYGSGDRAWAEEVTGDVFVTVMARVDRLGDQDDLGGWFYRVTTNHCLKRLRRDRVRRTFGLDGRARSADRPGAAAMARVDLQVVLAAMAALPPKERVALSMHALDGQTLTEIGEVLGHSKGYVSKLISRARARLAALDHRLA